MIETVADLLLELKNREVDLFKKYDIISHAPTIGEMYEGLSKTILKQTIFKDLNLKVSSGFIINQEKQISEQIDCMLVVGDGDEIPQTNDEIFPIAQVIAVIQVKKNLYSNDLISSHKNLLSVTKLVEEQTEEEYHNILLKDIFRSICQRELPSKDELPKLSIDLQYIYDVLLLEAFYPCQIIWGYNGFATEK